MAIQTQKSVSICGQPVCGLKIHPANLNIWMMTQEARSNLFSQSLPICYSDQVSSVPEDQFIQLALNLTQGGWFVCSTTNISSSSSLWDMLEHCNIWLALKCCFSYKTTKCIEVKTWQETSHKSSISLQEKWPQLQKKHARLDLKMHTDCKQDRFWHRIHSRCSQAWLNIVTQGMQRHKGQTTGHL